MARRGRAARLKNLRTTPDALPEVLSDQTVHAFEKYEVLSHRELESRFEVWAEQYTTIANIEAETAATMARTMLLPAALRHIALIDAAGMDSLAAETRALVDEFAEAISELEEANQYPDGVEGLDLAIYARDNQLTALAASASWATSSRRWWPTTSGRCRSTPRSCSSSRQPLGGGRGRSCGACRSAARVGTSSAATTASTPPTAEITKAAV